MDSHLLHGWRDGAHGRALRGHDRVEPRLLRHRRRLHLHLLPRRRRVEPSGRGAPGGVGRRRGHLRGLPSRFNSSNLWKDTFKVLPSLEIVLF